MMVLSMSYLHKLVELCAATGPEPEHLNTRQFLTKHNSNNNLKDMSF
jgi:hypothetical protein